MSSHSTMSTASSTTNTSGRTKSTVTSAMSQSADNQTRRRKQAHDVFNRLRDLIRDLEEFGTEYADFDKVIRERDDAIHDCRVLKHKLTKKKEEIHSLVESQNSSLDVFVNKLDKLRHENEELTRKSQMDKEQMAEQHSLEEQRTKEQLKSSQSQIASLSTDLKRANEDGRLLKIQLAATKQELAQWNDPISFLRPLDHGELPGKIEGLFRSCVKLAHSYFFDDLPDNVLSNYDAWEKDAAALNIPLRLLAPNNSPSGKLMRVAVAMSVLSGELAKTVFRPCYLPDSEENSASIHEVLRKCLPDDRRVKSFVRAQFLSPHSAEERRGVLQKWASTASSNVSRKISFMYRDSGTNFDVQTRVLFRRAADLWDEIQHVDGDIRVITLDGDHLTDWPWEHFEDLGNTTRTSEEALMLFPGFYAHDEQVALFKGFALWKDQEHVAKAESEWWASHKAKTLKLGPASPARHPPTRRQSVSIRGLVTPSSSAVSSPNRNQATGLLGHEEPLSQGAGTEK